MAAPHWRWPKSDETAETLVTHGGGDLYRLRVPMDERELDCPPDHPLIGWRIFRVRASGSGGYTLAAPLIHDPGFEAFPSRVIRATCYELDHHAPAPGCRCGLYAEVEGTLDSLSGYLLDSAHDSDPPIYAEVACTGRVFLDFRGVRAEQVEVVRLVTCDALWTDRDVKARAVRDLEQRYDVAVDDIGTMPPWVLANDMPQGAPPPGVTLDLDTLLGRLGLQAVSADAGDAADEPTPAPTPKRTW